MTSRIVVYITLESLMGENIVATKRSLNIFKNTDKIPKYAKDNQSYFIYDNLVTRLENLKNRKIIDSVLLLPFDYETTCEIINPEFINLFSRTYCSAQPYEGTSYTNEVDVICNNKIDEIINILNEYNTHNNLNLYYELLSKNDKSPSILLYHENKSILSHIASYLLDNKLIFSYYIENNYMKIYLNNNYLKLLDNDKSLYKDLLPDRLLTIYIGSNKEDLDQIGKCSAIILPFFLVEQKINECGFNSLASLISTVKSPLQNMDNLSNYAVNAQNELNSFISKITNDRGK